MYLSSERKIVMHHEVLETPGHLISLAARAFARLSEARLKPLGFGVGQVPVLVALADNLAGTQRDLARFAKVGQPPMAQMLVRMERDGLIDRTPDPTDKRSSNIALTAQAKERLPHACEVILQGNLEALAGFSEQEREQLGSLLVRLIANLDRMEATQAT
jgi:MarR family transcriptional regulator for hemolysin